MAVVCIVTVIVIIITNKQIIGASCRRVGERACVPTYEAITIVILTKHYII